MEPDLFARVFVSVFVYEPKSRTNIVLPARSRDLALRLASRKGVPASPLRFDPGTPFLDQHIYRCLWRGQVQSGERERAGSRKQTDDEQQENHWRPPDRAD
jgi:hypothetical protein